MKIDGFKIDVMIAEKGLKRREFCERCGIKSQTLYRAIRTNSTTMLTAVKIAGALDADVRDIIIA